MNFLCLTSTRPLQPTGPVAPGGNRTARGRPRAAGAEGPTLSGAPRETSGDRSGMVTMTRTRLIPVIGMFACACILGACSSDPTVSTDGEPPAAGPQTHPTTSPAVPTGSTPSSTQAPPGPGPAAGHGSATGRPGTHASSAATTVPSASSPPAPAPNVLGQSLAAAEHKLAAAGYGTAAHPWGGSCTTPNAIMQQVPPAQGSVQLFYCANPT
jgi:hypothetical protein